MGLCELQLKKSRKGTESHVSISKMDGRESEKQRGTNKERSPIWCLSRIWTGGCDWQEMSSEKLRCYLGVNREGLLGLKRPDTQRFKKVKVAGVAVDKYVMVIEKRDERITNDRASLTLPVRNLSHNKV